MEHDPESRVRKLKNKQQELANKIMELEQLKERKEKRNYLLDREVQDNINNVKNLQLLVSKQMETLDQQDDKDEQYEKMQKRHFLQRFSKQVAEKFSYHIDKYFRYLEECAARDLMLQEQQTGDMDNQYSAPPPTCAIQVKCPKSLLSKDVKFQDDNVDYVTATFRYSKINSFQDLKKATLVYWKIFNAEQAKLENQKEAGQTTYHEQQTKSKQEPKSQAAEQIDDILQKQQQGLLSPGSMQTTNRNLLQQTQRDAHQEPGNMEQILLEKFCNRYEIVNENQENIQNTELIERYYNQVLNDESVLYLCVMLKKKKVKLHRRQQEMKNMSHVSSHQASLIQGEKSQVSHGQNSANITFDGSKVSEEKPLTQIDENDEGNEEDQQEYNQQDLKNGLFRKFVTFFNRFPLLRKSFVINIEKVKKRGNAIEKNQKEALKGEKIDDNHICILFILFMLMMLNILFIFFIDNGAYIQQHMAKLKSIFNVTKFMSIASVEDMAEYYTSKQGLLYQFTSTSSEFNMQYELIGSVRFRQLRTKYSPCPYLVRKDRLPQVTCTYQTYNSDTFFTEMIGNGDYSWMYFTPRSDERVIVGQFSEYDSSGYIMDVTREQLSPVYYINEIIKGMFENPSYFNDTVLAQIMTLTVRSKNDGNFVFLEFLVEYPGTGVFPTQPTMLSFSPNIFGKFYNSPYSVFGEMHTEPPKSPSSENIGYILYIITVLKIIVGIVYTIFQLIKMKDSIQHGWTYFISIVFIINTMGQILNFTTADQAMSLFKMNYNNLDLVMETKFIDFGNVAALYQSILFMTSLCICAHLIRIYLLFDIFKSLEQAIGAIQSQYLQLLSSFMLLFLILSGFSYILMAVKGPYYENYSDFARSFIQIILILCNCSNVGQFYDYDPKLSLVFMVIFYFITYQFLFNILAIIYIDSYRQIVISEGQPESKILKKNNFLNWLLNWLPSSVYKKREQE